MIPSFYERVTQPHPDVAQHPHRSERVADASHRLLIQSNSLAYERDRLAAETENRKLRTLLIATETSEDRFRALIEAAPDAIIVTDRMGRISLVNRRTEVLFGFDREELLGQSIDVLLPEHDSTVTAVQHWYDTAIPSAYALGARQESVGRRCDGSELPVEIAFSRVSGQSGIHIVAIIRDVTEIKRAELALRAANEAAEAAMRQEAERRHEAERKRQIAESLRDVMSLLNSERPLRDILERIALQANRLFKSQATAVYRSGYETEAVLSQAERGSAHCSITCNHIDIDRATLRQTVLQRSAFVIADVPRALADATKQDPAPTPPAFMIPEAAGCSALLAVPILIKDEVYGGLVIYDTVPRLCAHEEIELANMFADQAALVIDNTRMKQQAIEAAAAQERNRLARDLHDAVTQTIFSANLMAEALPRVWEHDPDEGRRGLEQLHLLTRGALAEMRTLLFELRPAALLDKPLPELLRQLTEAMVARSQSSITFEADGTCALPAPVHMAIYRIAQEALNNAAKHAAARTVRVVLRCSPQRVMLRIRDDGRGFDANAVTADHFGITNMQERARPIGATCSIRSHPGEGTQVTVVWPAASAWRKRPHSATVEPLVVREPARRA